MRVEAQGWLSRGKELLRHLPPCPARVNDEPGRSMFTSRGGRQGMSVNHGLYAADGASHSGAEEGLRREFTPPSACSDP